MIRVCEFFQFLMRFFEVILFLNVIKKPNFLARFFDFFEFTEKIFKKNVRMSDFLKKKN